MNKRTTKPVRQLTLKGDLIKVFDSAKTASVKLNINNTSISKVCNYHADTAGGYRFEFQND